MALFDAPPTSVALVRLRVGLGDLLCTVPALRALRAHLPRTHIALVTWAEMAPVVERMRSWVDELVAFPGDPGIPERPPDTPAIEPFYAAMRERRWDVALQAYGARTAANEVTARFGARHTGGFFVPGELDADLRTHLPYPVHLHEIHRHLALLEFLGVPPGDDRLELPLTSADRAEAAAVLDAAGIAGRPLAVLHPGATSQSRRWPLERFAAVGDALAARGLAVAVSGVPSEAAATAAVVAAMRAPAADLAGRTSLGGYAALLGSAALLVANDTGSAHLAAAVGTPSVTLFLSGDPVRWAHDATRHPVARVQVECNPCPHLTCPIDHRCATRLGTDLVMAHADRLLERGVSRAA